MALGYFVGLRPRDNRVLGKAPEERRVLARAVLRLGQQANLLSFGLADNHVHAEPVCSRAVAGEMARRIELSLGRRLGVSCGFETAYVDPIESGSHLYNAFKYSLRQDRRHELDNDPLREATNLPDLLGLRVIGRYTAANVRQQLPRITRADLLSCYGLTCLEPMDGPVEHVVEATLAATALPDLLGRRAETVAARRAAVEVVGCRLTSRALATLVGVSERRVREIRNEAPPAPMLVNAIRLQLGLMEQLGQRLDHHRPYLSPPPPRR